MAKLKDTHINGDLSVSGDINIIGLYADITVNIDDELSNIYHTIEDVIPFPVEDDEEVTPNQ